MSDEYYDISVSACGFVNRVRTVEVKDGQTLLACTFAALRGKKGERAEPTYFDVKVVGSHARTLLTQYQDVINDRTRQVFASVRFSDLYVKPFVRQRGERKGESGYAVKTRLLAIESLAIDGNVVYRRSEDPTAGVRSARQPRDPQSDSANGGASTAPNGNSGSEQPEIVRLSKDDPAFEEKRLALINAGYRWNRIRGEWVRTGDTVKA